MDQKGKKIALVSLIAGAILILLGVLILAGVFSGGAKKNKLIEGKELELTVEKGESFTCTCTADDDSVYEIYVKGAKLKSVYDSNDKKVTYKNGSTVGTYTITLKEGEKYTFTFSSTSSKVTVSLNDE